MLLWLLSKMDPHLNSFNLVLVSETDDTKGRCLLKNTDYNSVCYHSCQENMLTFAGNIVTYINCGMNNRLHRSWLKITGVFTFTIGTGTTLIYAQVLRVNTNLEHAIFKASTVPVRFQVFYPLCD